MRGRAGELHGAGEHGTGREDGDGWEKVFLPRRSDDVVQKTDRLAETPACMTMADGVRRLASTVASFAEDLLNALCCTLAPPLGLRPREARHRFFLSGVHI